MMKECLLYKPRDHHTVECTACSQHCVIPPGQTGICGVRQNKDGKLFLLVYGSAAAVNIDPMEKKPLFHVLPGSDIFSLGTIGCNFGCSFCQNWDISQATKEIKLQLTKEKRMHEMAIRIGTYGYELPPETIVSLCGEKHIPSIAYTYNEPTIFFEYLYDTAQLAMKKNIKNVLVTNGYETKDALTMLKPVIHAMNIDLKAFTDSFYLKLCKAKLQPVLDTIALAHHLGIWIEITTLIIPGKNDSQEELEQIAQFIANIDQNIPWHVTAFHPDYQMLDVPATEADILLKAYHMGKKAGLKYVYVGNILDEDHASTFCPKCETPLVRRNGYAVALEHLDDGKCDQCGTSIPGIWQ